MKTVFLSVSTLKAFQVIVVVSYNDIMSVVIASVESIRHTTIAGTLFSCLAFFPYPLGAFLSNAMRAPVLSSLKRCIVCVCVCFCCLLLIVWTVSFYSLKFILSCHPIECYEKIILFMSNERSHSVLNIHLRLLLAISWNVHELVSYNFLSFLLCYIFRLLIACHLYLPHRLIKHHL